MVTGNFEARRYNWRLDQWWYTSRRHEKRLMSKRRRRARWD